MENEKIHEEVNRSSECVSIEEKSTMERAELEQDAVLLNLLFANVDDLIDVDYEAILGSISQPKRMEIRPKKNANIKK